MLRFCISREVDNLKIYFAEARNLKRLTQFYTLLAMRQVFTIPSSRDIRRGWFLVWAPKVFCFGPLIGHTAVTIHDFATADIGSVLNRLHTLILFSCEGVLLALITTLTIMVIKRLRRVDALWDEYWTEVLVDKQKCAEGQARE